MEIKINTSKVNRIEVINHANNSYQIGRLLTLYKELGDFDVADISMQDGGKTMKIFLNTELKEENNDKS